MNKGNPAATEDLRMMLAATVEAALFFHISSQILDNLRAAKVVASNTLTAGDMSQRDS